MPSQIVSLALAGVRAKAGAFNKSTGAQPASQSVTTPGFRPGAVFFASDQAVTQTAPVEITQARLGIGASDGARGGSSAICAADAVSPTNADGVDKTSKAFMKMDNATPVIDAEADLASFDPTRLYAQLDEERRRVDADLLFGARRPVAATALVVRRGVALRIAHGHAHRMLAMLVRVHDRRADVEKTTLSIVAVGQACRPKPCREARL